MNTARKLVNYPSSSLRLHHLHRRGHCSNFRSLCSSAITQEQLRGIVFSCARNASLFRLSSCLHALIIKNPPVSFSSTDEFAGSDDAQVIYNSLLHVYCKWGELRDAAKVFDDIPEKDTVSWNSLISGFLKRGELGLGFECFKSLIVSKLHQFDRASLTSLLSACDSVESLSIVKMIHAFAVSNGYYENEVTVGNALTTAYFKCQCFEHGMRVFERMQERSVVTWTAVISGLAQNELYDESLKLFADMYNRSMVSPNCLTYLTAITACAGLQCLKQGSQIHAAVVKSGFQFDLRIESALMDLYSKCGCVEEAWKIFESAKIVDGVSVTVLLTGLAQNGFEEEAMEMFVKVVKAGTTTDPNMISAILGVFSIITSQGLGLQIHSLIIKKGFDSSIFVCNGLINMYSKCGQLKESLRIFSSAPHKNQVSWNSMIAAFARHGNGSKALQLYEEMRANEIEPTDVTFLSLLHACAHVGLVQKGVEFLQSMERQHGLRPRMEHYACVVDMLGRAGLVKEAKKFIDEMPVKADVLIWQSLLGACSIYNDVETGNYAADRLAEAAPNSPVPYISMANIYSSRGRWKERAKIIKKMKEKGVMKETGVSWIEVEKKIHRFVVADELHCQSYLIYGILLDLFLHMRDELCEGDDDKHQDFITRSPT